MKLEIKGNKNYCASIVKISNLSPLENCTNICGTMIFGCHVIVSKDTKIGDMGIYFPVETKISDEFLKCNNLFRDPLLNKNQTKKGFFEKNGRVRAMKLRGNISDGIFLPLESLLPLVDIQGFKENDIFDHINGNKICEKYIVVQRNQNGSGQGKKGKQPKRISRLIDGQFHFHIDTDQFARNIHKIQPYDLISITQKLHGTSTISSKILTKKKLSVPLRVLRKLGVPIIDTEYDIIWASRKVIKNQYEDNLSNGYYKEDIWKTVTDKLKDYLTEGLIVYGEAVGFLKSGAYIQKGFDYGCKPREHKIYIYRITYTNSSGKIYEFSAKQVQQWCKLNGLNAVPELYYGLAIDLFKPIKTWADVDIRTWQQKFLEFLLNEYLEKDCEYCSDYKGKKVPAEGIVLRKEVLGIECYKLKSWKFKEWESKANDKGESNIEDEN